MSNLKITLPMDAFIPGLLQSLESKPVAILVAEPGAGKTTRVPPALAEAPWAAGKAIWVLQPRRLAAYVAAARVSEEAGSALGGFAGYHFRFDRTEGKDTRVLFLTEGMFLRRLQGNPTLDGVAAVVVDEFHERSLDADLGLALLRRLRQTRPELRLLVMSATLDSAALGAALEAPVLDCPGRAYPVEVHYSEKDRSDPNEPVEKRVSKALRDLAPGAGDILVFLPGTGEIRRTASRLAADPAFDAYKVLQLHGGLSAEEQRAALAPAPKPKVILSTNVAETSLTVPGVRIVMDSGLVRRDAWNPWTGLSALLTLPASQASMTQRAGRAGREAPGVALRLCSAAEYGMRARFDTPELARADLSGAALQSLAAGFGALETLDWVEAPPPEHLASAARLLTDLGAVDASGKLTPKGLALAKAPLHPRLAAVAWEAAPAGGEQREELLRCLVILSEERTRNLDFWSALSRYSPEGITKRLWQQLGDWLKDANPPLAEPKRPWRERLALALIRAFPDQVAYSKHGSDKRGETRFVLASGGEAMCRDDALRLHEGYYLLLEILEQKALGGQGWAPRVLSLIPLEQAWLLDGVANRVREEARVSWDSQRQRVQSEAVLSYGSLVLDKGPLNSPEGLAQAGRYLLAEARKAGLSYFCGEQQPQRYLGRRTHALALDPAAKSLPDEEALWARLAELCEQGAQSFEELRSADVLRLTLEALSPAQKAMLEAGAPKTLRLPSGKELALHFEPGKPPWVQSRLQDFFGQAQTPSVAGTPVVVHLLAPNGRPQQVTRDLAGFWDREYPRLRKELMRKYPKHAWPEDPLSATPPKGRR